MIEAGLLFRCGFLVTFTKRPARSPPSVSQRGRFARASPVLLLVLRLGLFALIAIAGAAWALVRHCTHELPPMRVPIRSPAPAFDADAGELPAPSLLEPGSNDALRANEALSGRPR